MKVLMVEPGKVPYAAEIGEGLEPLQAAVGGDIQAVYPYDDPVALICNEEGKYMGLPLNRALHDDEGNIYDIVAGNFFLCGLGEEDFTDLPADLMEKYQHQMCIRDSPRTWPLTWMCSCGSTVTLMRICTPFSMRKKNAWRTNSFPGRPERYA